MRNLKSVTLSIALLFLSHAHASYCRAQTPKEPGSITGRVKLDGKPAKGITITAAPAANSPSQMVEEMFGSSASMKTMTDSEGVYRIEGVPAGKYSVAPSAPALVNSNPKQGSEITVSEGAASEDVDFSLSLGGVITGKITDGDGRPVIGERISLKPVDSADAPTIIPILSRALGNRMYTTDDRGIYRIFGLPPGRYLVSAGKGSDIMAAFLSQQPKRVQTFYPGVIEEAKAKRIQVTPGSEAAGVDIQFSTTDKGFEVSGRVVDSEKNTPIANAMVAYSKTRKSTDEIRVQIDSGGDFPGMPGGFTTTNDKGEFRFVSVTPGNYKLEATSIGALAGADGSQFYADPVNFDVQSTNLDKIDIKVHRGASITGTVIIESADAQDSIDRYGQIALMAMVVDSESKSQSAGNCVVGADGTFRLGGLKPGKVTMRTFSMSNRRPGILRIERNGVEVQGAFDIQQNEQVNGVRVVLSPGIGVIRGRVTIQGGALEPGAKLMARARLIQGGPLDSDDDGGIDVDVSSNGSFIIEHLTPGSYEVQVTTTVRGQRGSRTVSAKQTVTVTGENAVEVDLVLDLSPKPSDR